MNKSVAIVTGASRGIGKATALRLKQEGYVVVGFYRADVKAAKLLVDVGVEMYQVDVSNEGDVKQAIARVLDTNKRLDIVVNNAGINLLSSIEECSIEEWNSMMATDLGSVFLMSKYAIPHLKKSSEACIINISSRIGLNEYAEANFVPYGAMKAAVNNFTVGLARELAGSGIRVNAVIPTPTKTDLFDQVFTPEDEEVLKAKGKLGSPDDVAELVMKTIQDTSLTGELVFDKRVFL